ISILPRTVPTATTSTLGIVKPDNSTVIISSGGIISVPTATTSTLGIVRPDNSTVKISNGIVSAINIINYITNWNFEGNSTIGWTTYANIAQSTPTDGITGYSNITFAINNITPLFGLYDGLFTKAAVNYQGQGLSYTFTTDSGVLTAPLQIAFTYMTSANYVASDIGVYVYDVTNAILIYPSVINLPQGTEATSFIALFNPNLTSTNYRLI